MKLDAGFQSSLHSACRKACYAMVMYNNRQNHRKRMTVHAGFSLCKHKLDLVRVILKVAWYYWRLTIHVLLVMCVYQHGNTSEVTLLLTMHVLLVMCVYQHGNTSEVTLLLITVDNACIVGHVFRASWLFTSPASLPSISSFFHAIMADRSVISPFFQSTIFEFVINDCFPSMYVI